MFQRKKKVIKKKEKKNKKNLPLPSELVEVLNDNTYLDCQSELEEEEYFS